MTSFHQLQLGRSDEEEGSHHLTSRRFDVTVSKWNQMTHAKISILRFDLQDGIWVEAAL